VAAAISIKRNDQQFFLELQTGLDSHQEIQSCLRNTWYYTVHLTCKDTTRAKKKEKDFEVVTSTDIQSQKKKKAGRIICHTSLAMSFHIDSS